MWWIINVITAVLLICNVVPKSSNKETYCYGDICNRATDNQFCSDYFKMCRNCADIIMDCGTEQQPSSCTPYCINYKVELELQKKQGSNCTASSSMLRIAVNTTRNEYQQGDIIGIACEDGYEPHFTNTAQCGEFGVFNFSSPTCEVKTCSLSPMVANAYVTPKPDTDGRFPINTNVTITCKESFTLIGENTMKCLGDGKWTEEAPFCLAISYTWWYYVGDELVAICATLFFVAVVFLSVILWLRRKLLKQMKGASLTSSDPSIESGVDVDDDDQDETSPMVYNGNLAGVRQTVIDEKDRDSNDPANSKEASNPDRPAIPSAPQPTYCNSKINPSGVASHHTSYTCNIFGNVTNKTDNIKVENHDDKNDHKPDRKQPEDEHVPEKTPTEETQTTVVAHQETKDGTCKGARPFTDHNDTDIALDSVPKCLKKLYVDDCS